MASLEAEPVLYQSCTRPTWNSGVPWTEWKERSREGYEDDLRFTDTPDHAGWINKCRKLYTTPPVPVIQADVAQAIENLKQKLVECNRYNYCADAVKGVEDACHAAMLQGSQPVSQTYKLPVNTPCQDAPAHIWLQTAGVWPEDGELSELTWCSHNQHHDDTLYVRADLVNGNSPVTPDGWISRFEEMPDPSSEKRVCAFTPTNHEDMRYRFVPASLFKTVCRDATHWFYMLPPVGREEVAGG
ncbi:hypothetical protein LGN34_20435 [Escherichia coli]|nr:hypothetical protein [Escherichia coli]MCA8553240.1 hypothetical protein [Escherichia coli]MCA8636715.1 hypothetical protein [Escherichia coli]